MFNAPLLNIFIQYTFLILLFSFYDINAPMLQLHLCRLSCIVYFYKFKRNFFIGVDTPRVFVFWTARLLQCKVNSEQIRKPSYLNEHFLPYALSLT